MIDPEALQAKSDQMNAVDFANSIVFRVHKAIYLGAGKEQSVHILMEGHEDRPYKPNKGMLRGLVSSQVWSMDETTWAGKLIELDCDPTVKWAGKEVGGIVINAVSGITEPYNFTVAKSRNQRYVHTFNVLNDSTEVKKEFIKTHYIDDIEQAKTSADLDAIVSAVSKTFGADSLAEIKDAVVTARGVLNNG